MLRRALAAPLLLYHTDGCVESRKSRQRSFPTLKTYNPFLLVAALFLPVPSASAATVLFCPLDSVQGWSIRTMGPAKVSLGRSAPAMSCAEISSQGGTAFLTRELPLDAVQGCHVALSCLAKCDDIVRGPQLSSTAKVHLAVRTPRGIEHHHAWLTGTAEWHREAFTADVPADAQQVVLSIGLEACRGRALFSRLLVQNDRQRVYPLKLAEAANADHAQLGLEVFPSGTVLWQDIPFNMLDQAAGNAVDCLRLRGMDHADWPVRTTVSIKVNSPATTIYILHGALQGQPRNDSPCAIWTAHFADGQESTFSIFEGRDIGPIGGAENLENWQVAWRQQDAQGRGVSFGVTRWTPHCDVPVLGLSCQAYQGASPVVLAVTVVEAPPTPRIHVSDAEAEEEP